MSTFNGTNGNDILPGDNRKNSGDDHFFPKLGIDMVDGGAGDDWLTIDYHRAQTWVVGVFGGDSGFAGTVNDFNGNQVDFLNIEHVNVVSGSSNDSFYVYGTALLSHDSVSIDAGGGFDQITVDASMFTTNINFSTWGTTSFSNIGTYSNFEAFTVNGGSGNDHIATGAGDDYLFGGAGNDYLDGGAGNDHIVGGSGFNQLYGGAGDDVFGTFEEFAGIDKILGGEGHDIWNANFADATSDLQFTVSANGSGHVSNGATCDSVENVQIASGSGNDTLFTNGGQAYFEGGAGFDVLNVDYSHMTVSMGAGVTYGPFGHYSAGAQDNSGINSINAYDVEQANFQLGSGNDGFSMEFYDDPGQIKVRADGGAGFDELYLGAGILNGDTVFLADGNSIVTNRGTITGFEKFSISTGAGNDIVHTANADDFIFTGEGIDQLSSGGGNDTLMAGNGNDQLNGGTGDDRLEGGQGADTFVFSDLHFGNDTIFDFESGVDKLNFTAAVATAFSDFTISRNGTSQVILTHGTDSIVIDSHDSLTLSASDFIFA